MSDSITFLADSMLSASITIIDPTSFMGASGDAIDSGASSPPPNSAPRSVRAHVTEGNRCYALNVPLAKIFFAFARCDSRTAMRRLKASGSVMSGAHTANLYSVGPEVDIAASWVLRRRGSEVRVEALVGMDQKEDRVRAGKARIAGVIGGWKGGLRYPRTARESMLKVQEAARESRYAVVGGKDALPMRASS